MNCPSLIGLQSSKFQTATRTFYAWQGNPGKCSHAHTDLPPTSIACSPLLCTAVAPQAHVHHLSTVDADTLCLCLLNLYFILCTCSPQRPHRAACFVRDTFANHDDADHNDHQHRDARASSSDFNLAMLSNGRGSNGRAKRKDTADENPCDGTQFTAKTGYRTARGYTNHGIYHCDSGCDGDCNIFGSNCDDSCESDCECNAGYAYPHHQSQSAAAAGCAANPCNGRNTYQSKGDKEYCADARTGCNSGNYWRDASITAAGICTPVPTGYYVTGANYNQLAADVKQWSAACGLDEYQSVPPTAYQDRRCNVCSNIQCGNNYYRAGSCSGSTNGYQCNACSNIACPDNQFRSGECEGTANNYQCNTCSNINCGSNQFRSGECAGTANNYQCNTCSNINCGNGQFRNGECTGTANNYQCNTCSNINCGDDEYRSGSCSGTYDGYACTFASSMPTPAP